MEAIEQFRKSWSQLKKFNKFFKANERIEEFRFGCNKKIFKQTLHEIERSSRRNQHFGSEVRWSWRFGEIRRKFFETEMIEIHSILSLPPFNAIRLIKRHYVKKCAHCTSVIMFALSFMTCRRLSRYLFRLKLLPHSAPRLHLSYDKWSIDGNLVGSQQGGLFTILSVRFERR